jgi:hypothetical protein
MWAQQGLRDPPLEFQARLVRQQSWVRHPTGHLHRFKRMLPVLSQRKPKDPSMYDNIEDIRRELEQAKGSVPFSLTRTIQWLGEAANNGGGSLAFRAYSWVLGLDQPAGWRRPQESAEEERERLKEIEDRIETSSAAEGKINLQQLQTILILSRQSVLKLIRRCPELEHVSSADLITRMMDLKQLFPNNDIARMVELVPKGFLVSPWDSTYAQLEESSSILREGLKGADVDAIFEEDPTILFEEPESLRVGLERMNDLWNIDEEMLENSFPDELALAVRALGLKGAPKQINRFFS